MHQDVLSHPRIIGPSEASGICGGAPLTLLPFLTKLEFKLGLDYSEYLLGRMRTHAENGDALELYLSTFQDSDRAVTTQTLGDYLHAPQAGVPKGRIVGLAQSPFANLSPRPTDVRCFLGDRGHTGDLHFDWNRSVNYLVNVCGSKVVRLYAPGRSVELGAFSNFSLKKGGRPDVEIEMGPGEGVVIPAFWWHQVSYQERAVSVSLRFSERLREDDWYYAFYPSWKFVHLLSTPDGEQQLRDFAQGLATKKIEERYAQIENFYRSFAGLADIDDHEFYEAWAKAQILFQQRNPDFTLKSSATSTDR
jgi:hypothetical protein